VRPELAEMIVDALNRGVSPTVRSLGSVGQADLGPLADLAEGLLRKTGFVLQENEGLALINNNAFATGWAGLAQLAAERLLGEAEVAAALALEGFAGNLSILHPVVAEVRPHPGLASGERPPPRTARRELPVRARSRPKPAGPAHLPEHPPDPRRGQGHPGFYPGHDRD